MPENTGSGELEAIISDLRSEVEWCIDPHRLSGVSVDRERAEKAEAKAINSIEALIASRVEEARIQQIKYLLTTIRSFDKYIVPGVNGGSELVDFGSVVNLLERDLKALQSKEGEK